MSEESDDTTRKEELVITPGGPRPKDRVHLVRPGEAVSVDESGNARVIPLEQEGESVNMATEMVLTPGGYRPKSLVHLIEPGHVLDGTGGHHRKLDPSGRVVADFGPIPTRPSNEPLMPRNVSVLPRAVPGLGSGWITYADWTNNTGNPISSFTTTWTVPPAPDTQSGQVVFLFNGIQNSTMIYQPVLQWGSSAAGGGNYWAVASWYVDGQGGPAFHSQLIQVNPGQTLVGVMTLTGQSGNGFSYNCQFQGIANSGYAIQNVQQLTWCIETLEAYGITQRSNYPETDHTSFRAINIQTGSSTPALNWTPVNSVTDCGQHAMVISNANPGGEVDLYYRIQNIVSAVVSWGANRLDIFGLGTDNQMYHKYWNGQQWGPSQTGWEALGGVFNSPPDAVSWASNRLDIFGLGTDNQMYHKAWNGQQWLPSQTGWEALGGVFNSPPSAAAWSANRLDIFGLGTDNQMYHKYWNGQQWGPSQTGWEALGGIFNSPPSVVAWGPNRLDIFGLGTDNQMYHKAWNGQQWLPSQTGWEALGGVFNSPPDAVSWGANRLDIFGLGTDDQMYHKYWNGQQWGPSQTGWEALGGVFHSPPDAVSWGANRLDIFGLGTDNQMYHKAWNGQQWLPSQTGWEALGGVFNSPPDAVSWASNRLDIFGLGTDFQMYHKYWNGQQWGPSQTAWEALGGVFHTL